MEVSHGLKYIYLTCFLWIWVLYVSLGRWQEISKMELISDFFFIYSFVCLFIVRPLFFPYKRGRTRILRYACKTDQDDFTHWIYFWPSNLMEEISPISGINVLIYTAWKMSVFGVSVVRSDWIRRNTEYLSVSSPNVGKRGPEKLQIWTIIMQW